MIKQIVGVLVMVLLGSTVAADGKGSSNSLAQQAQVEDLPVCYARGTDALGSATGALNTDGDLNSTVNLTDPDFARALKLYRACFSKDFAFTLEFDGVPALTVPDPLSRTRDTDAALQWANFVNNAFRGPGYRSTQHHMGSISSSIRGKRGHVVSYLIATHVFGANAAQPEGSTAVVGGTYTDRVVLERGRWVIKQRTLNITSSVVNLAP